MFRSIVDALIVLGGWLLSTAHAATPALWNPAEGMVLKGKIVTLNDAGTVLSEGYLFIRNVRIEAIAQTRRDLPQDAKKAIFVDTGGVIYPGLIDLHNHPEYAIYPLLPITRKYRDRYEWRYYDDDYNKRITFPQLMMTGAQYFDLGLEVGRYGEYKALAGGTTTLQGARPLLPYAKEECLVRNIETSLVSSRMAFSRVDMGRDAEEWKKIQEEKNRGLLVLHLAEGPSPRMADEFRAIKASGLLGPELIVIHGIGLNEVHFKEMAAAGAKLVWSPLSNFMLYGKTADIDAVRRAGLPISLAPDWAPSGSKSVLGELKVADLVNKNQLKTPFTDHELVEMVTRNPARALGWQDRVGQIAPGFLADLIVIDERKSDPYRNLIEAIEENLRLVVVRGEPLYGDRVLLQRVRDAGDIETVTTFGGTREKVLAPNCPGTALPVMRLAETRGRLQQALNFDSAYVAKKVSLEQFVRDLLICGDSKPADPPTSADAQRFLTCRYGLPFEETKLSPLTTNDDTDFFSRFMANPNLPAYLKQLPAYYHK